MIDTQVMSGRVDRYVRGELDDSEIEAFEAALLESCELQDALEIALGLQRIVKLERTPAAAKVIKLPSKAAPEVATERLRRQWPLAASLAAAAVVATLLWRSETENAFLNSRVTALEQPVQSVLTVPLDVMRSFGSDTPDVRIRKPAGPALLILDIEVSAPMAGAPALGLELHKEQGDQILQLSSVPDADGRIQLALRTDQLPDGIVTLRISESASGPADTRFIELLPAGR